METQGYLVNVANPSLAPSQDFIVKDRAVRLTAGGFSGGDVVQLQIWVGDPVNGSFVNLARNGSLVQLTATNNQHIEIVAGKYKALYSGSTSTMVCYYDTDDLSLDRSAYYNIQVGLGV
jgi:hypothetical protein